MVVVVFTILIWLRLWYMVTSWRDKGRSWLCYIFTHYLDELGVRQGPCVWHSGRGGFQTWGPNVYEDQLRSEWGWCWLLGHHVSNADVPWNSLLGDGEWVLQPCPYQLCLLPGLQMVSVSSRNGFNNIWSWSREMSGRRDWWVDCDIDITTGGVGARCWYRQRRTGLLDVEG